MRTADDSLQTAEIAACTLQPAEHAFSTMPRTHEKTRPRKPVLHHHDRDGDHHDGDQ
jgi:hypothetical protein